MGYFDGLTASNFKTGKNGDKLFFPYGVIGKGYVLNKEKEQELRKFVKWYYVVTLPIAIGLGRIDNYIVVLLFFISISLIYHISIKRKTANLQISSEKLKFTESLSNSAKKHNMITLWFLFICSLLFVIGGLIIVADTDKFIMGFSAVVFFGLTSVILFMLIRYKTLNS